MSLRGATETDEQTPISKSEYWYPDGSFKSSNSYTLPLSYTHRSFTGEDIPSYNKRRKRGDLLPYTNYTNLEIEERATLSGSSSHPDGSRATLSNFAGLYAVPQRLSPGYIASLGTDVSTDKYVQAAAAQVYESQKFDALTALLEMKKLHRLFSNAGNLLLDLIKGRNLSQSWLESRYGWRVLYYELVSLSEAIDKFGNDRTRFSQRAGSSDHRIVESSSIYWTQATEHSMVVTDIIDFSIRGSVTADISPPSFSFNPAITAWELVRYSFIVDWFIGIGRWLASMSFLAFQTAYSAAGSVMLTLTRSYKSEPTGNFVSGYTSGNYSFSGFGSAKSIVRVPTSVSNIPHLNVNLSIAKILDLVAIVIRNLR